MVSVISSKKYLHKIYPTDEFTSACSYVIYDIIPYIDGRHYKILPVYIIYVSEETYSGSIFLIFKAWLISLYFELISNEGGKLWRLWTVAMTE